MRKWLGKGECDCAGVSKSCTSMKFFECFLGQDANKTSCLLKVFNHFASWDIFGEVPCLPVSQVHPFGKKYNKISQFQGFKTVLPIDERPGSGWWQSLGWCFCGILDDWIYLIGWWLMVGKNWAMKKNWPQVFLGRHFPFSTCICTICTCIPKVNHWVFVESKESQDHRNSNLEVGETLNFTQSWCVQGNFDDKNSQA